MAKSEFPRCADEVRMSFPDGPTLACRRHLSRFSKLLKIIQYINFPLRGAAGFAVVKCCPGVIISTNCGCQKNFFFFDSLYTILWPDSV